MRVLLGVSENLVSQFLHWLNKSGHEITTTNNMDFTQYYNSKAFDIMILESSPRDTLTNTIWITDSISAKYKTVQWPFSIANLVTSISVAAEENEIKINSGFVLNQRQDALYINGYLVHLSNKEMQLLKYIYNKNGGISSRAELLEEIWGMNTSSSPRSVDTSICRLKQKLGDYYTKLQSVSGGGYRWVDDE